MRKLRLKEGRVRIEFERERAGGGWDEFALASLDEPRPELGATLQTLAVDVLEICELPEDYGAGLTLTGVSWSFGGDADTMGAVLIAQKKLATADAPLNITTPHLASGQYSEGGASPLLSAEAIERLDALAEECLRYVDGDRAQGSLFSADPAEELRAAAAQLANGTFEEAEQAVRERFAPELLAAARRLQPRKGSSIETVTISAGGESVTLGQPT